MYKPTTSLFLYIFLAVTVIFMCYVIRAATMLDTRPTAFTRAQPTTQPTTQPTVLTRPFMPTRPQPPAPLSGSKAYTINIGTITDTRDEWKTNKARFISLVKPHCQNIDKFYAEADSDTTTFSLAVKMCGFKEAAKICNTLQSK